MAKHRIIIELEGGTLKNVHASGETDVILITENVNAKIEPDTTFRIGEGYKLYNGSISKFLKSIGV